jgi:hypothetical protein
MLSQMFNVLFIHQSYIYAQPIIIPSFSCPCMILTRLGKAWRNVWSCSVPRFPSLLALSTYVIIYLFVFLLLYSVIYSFLSSIHILLWFFSRQHKKFSNKSIQHHYTNIGFILCLNWFVQKFVVLTAENPHCDTQQDADNKDTYLIIYLYLSRLLLRTSLLFIELLMDDLLICC